MKIWYINNQCSRKNVESHTMHANVHVLCPTGTGCQFVGWSSLPVGFRRSYRTVNAGCGLCCSCRLVCPIRARLGKNLVI